MSNTQLSSIGLFDSGYGGLTVLKSIQSALPQNDFLYLGDNARAPYGTKTFEEIYVNTRECVAHLFAQGCPLVILACNTASARALRTIQQRDLFDIQRYPYQRVLGVIRPTAEMLGEFTSSRQVGILGTSGTINSNSYEIEIKKYHPDVTVHQQACPTWVNHIEAAAHNNQDVIKQIQSDVSTLLNKHHEIDCILLACTHYPLVAHHIRAILPSHVRLLEQGNIVANKTINYLSRHTDIFQQCATNSQAEFFTTGNIIDFEKHAGWFYGNPVSVHKIQLG